MYREGTARRFPLRPAPVNAGTGLGKRTTPRLPGPVRTDHRGQWDRSRHPDACGPSRCIVGVVVAVIVAPSSPGSKRSKGKMSRCARAQGRKPSSPASRRRTRYGERAVGWMGVRSED
ncbi:hypothetical protein FTUN_2895 [Frigoriglobus tundricola]|uniref:Uncharacterized protein n=1 Tax=Frigoriglobus tundricola TaxID=2774151 RepID=A0A6M5YMQ7_9BACT|nr:hypothetical protein FTUN_2895 [Frigoriglobus tundricola]